MALATHSSAPNGWLRFTLCRNLRSSASVSGSFTMEIQFGGRSTGHSLNSDFASA
jgi:hypothetical protein